MNSGSFINESSFLKWGLTVLGVSLLLYVLTGTYLVLLLPCLWVYLILVAKNWKIAYWMFLFSVPLSVGFSFAGKTLSLSFPDEPLMIVFLALSCLLVAYKPSRPARWWYSDPIVVIIVLQFAWLLLSVIFSTVPLYSLKFLLSKAWLLAAFFVCPVWILREKEDIKMAFALMFAAILLTMLPVFVRQAQFGFKFSEINNAIGFLYENHVEYSAVLSMFFPFVFIACIYYRRVQSQKALLLFVAAAFFILMIFLSYARAAVLAIAFSLLVYYLIRKRAVGYLIPSIYFVITIGLFFIIKTEKYIDLRPDYEKTHMYWDFSEHMKATLQGRDESSMERLYRWIAAMRMSNERPVFGFGPHGFYYNYQNYALRSFKTYASANTARSTTHNYFLYMLAEQGYPAMLLYAILNVVIFTKAQRLYHLLRDRFYKLCAMGLAMSLGASFVNNFFSELIDTHKVGCIFYLSLALLVILQQKYSKERAAQPGVAI
jgi:O-antigen ligase